MRTAKTATLLTTALLLTACAGDPNRVAGVECKERWIDVHTASVDDLAAFIAADPSPACYWRPPQPARAVPRYNWPGM